MKKSNKLLLAGFLTLVLLLTLVHIVLYAKYKNGNYTIYNAQAEMASHAQSFPHIMFVSVRDVRDASINFTDSAQLSKDETEFFDYVQKGDSLLITGKHDELGGYRVTFNLPYNAKLSATNSVLFFNAGSKSAGSSTVIDLQNSHAIFSGIKTPLRFGNINIKASDSSAALFHGNTSVSMLDVQLSVSTFEYGEGELGQISIVTDSVSRVSLQSKHLLKANIKAITQ